MSVVAERCRLLGSGYKGYHVDVFLDFQTGRLEGKWNQEGGTVRYDKNVTGEPVHVPDVVYLCGIYHDMDAGQVDRLVYTMAIAAAVNHAFGKPVMAEDMYIIAECMNARYDAPIR